jgi:pyrroline-5-carboxylate reductase
MFLIGGGFLALEARPFLFEFSGGHGSVANSESFIPSGMAGVCAGKLSASIPGATASLNLIPNSIARTNDGTTTVFQAN